jgi:hypothetical protein
MDLRDRNLRNRHDTPDQLLVRRSAAARGPRSVRLMAALAWLALVPAAAWAQLLTVPQMGITGDWVKRLEIQLESEWEWIQTAEDRVFFATRLGASRKDDIVTMWIRVEFRDPQAAGKHLSVAEKDEWDCRSRKRSTLATTLHRWNNLQDASPNSAAAALRTWEDVGKDTVGEALLEFACSIHPRSPLVAPVDAKGSTGKAR